ncbi:protein NRT1/ PTR FAMILY 5.5 isoform X2 [Macadamia integrifolia]|uniref:protein NRT1/ PTR FAMILY 5.5 isoform X2 n=1 Tax=Macadamia integrifolia TaxID=60698 RepID=UPI001C4EF4E1|nr:protein NRT1/ PTR FAMILY 5.5 isoform X2 [Macadamia integrifolia]
MASVMGPYLKITVLIWADVLAAYALWVMQTYLTNVWKMSITNAAAIVNVFTGVSTLLPLALTFLMDTFFGNFWMLLFSSLSYCVGMGFLAMSTPPVLSAATGTCNNYDPACIGDTQTVLFYISLVLIAFGMAGHISSLGPFIMDQVPPEAGGNVEAPPNEAPYVCLAIFAMVLVPIIAVFALPYIKPWSIRFGIPAICTLVSTLIFLSGLHSYIYVEPRGSSLTHIFQVYVASTLKIHHHRPRDAAQLYERDDHDDDLVPHTNRFRCLDKAAIILPNQTQEEQERNKWKLCRVTEVEETKITIPKVEARRINVITKHGLLDKPDETIPMSIFWLLPQFLLLGAMDGLARKGVEGFFHDQVPKSMRAYMVLFTEAVFGAGIIASVLSVYISNKVSKRGGRQGWFQYTLNRSRLDNYYWTLAALSAINLVFFAVVASCYSYKDGEIEDDEDDLSEDEETSAPYDDSASCCCC